MTHRIRLLLIIGSIVAIGVIGGFASFALLRPKPARLLMTARAGDDTVVVNQIHITQLSALVLDQFGRRLPADTAVRYRRISGDSISLSSSGKVLCEKQSDAVVRAAFDSLFEDFVLRCRPVASIESPSWFEFVVGDTGRDLSFTARGPDGRVVRELRGSVTVPNASVAGVEGTTIRPRQSGQTVAVVDIGNREAKIFVIVYRLVSSFVDVRRNEPLMAMHVHLVRGDTIERPLPKAAFWVTYFSADRTVPPPTIELRGDGSCTTGDGLNAMRIEDGEYAKYCHTGDGARMMIAHGAVGAGVVDGTVAIRLVW